MLQLRPLFAVPFGFDQHPDCALLNTQLRALFVARETDRYANPHPSTPRNAQMFESHFDLFQWPEPCIQRLREFCLAGVLRTAAMLNGYEAKEVSDLYISTDAWFHVTRRNGYFGVHNHPNASWSAVYCVSSGRNDSDQPDSGALSFINPHSTKMMHVDPGNARMLEPPFGWANFNFHMEPGQLVVFPSWVLHQVLPFYGEGERITVALNCAFRRREG